MATTWYSSWSTGSTIGGGGRAVVDVDHRLKEDDSSGVTDLVDDADGGDLVRAFC